jgi:hypothetical protein
MIKKWRKENKHYSSMTNWFIDKREKYYFKIWSFWVSKGPEFYAGFHMELY